MKILKKKKWNLERKNLKMRYKHFTKVWAKLKFSLSEYNPGSIQIDLLKLEFILIRILLRLWKAIKLIIEIFLFDLWLVDKLLNYYNQSGWSSSISGLLSLQSIGYLVILGLSYRIYLSILSIIGSSGGSSTNSSSVY
jgi:hypothetical protein